MELPKKKSEVKKNIEDYIVLLYGEPKIGKTTFCSQFEDPLFLLTEAGTNALSVYSLNITSWLEFKEAVSLIVKSIKQGDFKFKTIVIDTFDNLCNLCTEYCMKENGASHPSDIPFGKGYDIIGKEMLKALTFLSLLPVGLVLTCHEKTEEIKTRTSSYNKVMPSPSGVYRRIIVGMSDIVLYAQSAQTKDSDGKVVNKRVLRTKTTEYWEAGDRTNSLPETLDFSFGKFIEAWNKNKVEKRGN